MPCYCIEISFVLVGVTLWRIAALMYSIGVCVTLWRIFTLKYIFILVCVTFEGSLLWYIFISACVDSLWIWLGPEWSCIVLITRWLNMDMARPRMALHYLWPADIFVLAWLYKYTPAIWIIRFGMPWAELAFVYIVGRLFSMALPLALLWLDRSLRFYGLASLHMPALFMIWPMALRIDVARPYGPARYYGLAFMTSVNCCVYFVMRWPLNGLRVFELYIYIYTCGFLYGYDSASI